ncbi:MAG: beta-ketoacyl synthase N-terminal-like domain-containing protein [Candidatus Omnitrophota bacterium]|jgi:3-oxoacyl-[acyl-carrier-protein] synthase II
MQKKRVVITGMGVIAPNGIGKEDFWNAIKNGVSGINLITRFNPAEFPTKIAGEVKDFDPAKYLDHKMARRIDRFVQLALSCAKMAFVDSSLSLTKENPEKTGVMVGTATAGQGWVFTQYEIFREKGYKKLNPFTAASTFPNAASGQISIEFNINGPSDTISSGCASSSAAIGHAVELIRSGKTDVMFTGGTEALLYPPIFGTYCAARVMSTLNNRTPKPFDKNRDGIILSEGAAMLILESLEHALNRKARIYAEIAGWGVTCDGFSMMTLKEDGKEMARSIKLALNDAGLTTKNIDYIKAYGSAGELNDRIETKVIKEVFGEDA